MPFAPLLLASLLAAPPPADAGRLQRHQEGIWSLPATATHRRWVVIHGLAAAERTGVYHVEVLARGREDPAWKVERLRPHLAISADALARSVVAPLGTGAVYPEPFDDAYRRWREEAARGEAFVCRTTVLECLGVAGPARRREVSGSARP